MEKREQASAKKPATKRTAKKPYVKPAWVSEKIFETTALACAKMPGQGGACNAAPKLS